MDWEKARYFMVEQQIRPWDVLDPTVLDLLFKVRREEFVPQDKRDLALVDMELPLGNGQKMWQPKLEARVVQELMITSSDRVLEIGTGTGYLTALMASLASQVTSVEINAEQAEVAVANLKKAGIRNAKVVVGDASLGWNAPTTFDVIVVGASLPVVPDELKNQLAVGGRLFVVSGDLPIMSGTLITRSTEGFSSTKLFETVLPQLQNARQPERFVF